MQAIFLWSPNQNELEEFAFRPFQYLASTKDWDIEMVICYGRMLSLFSQFSLNIPNTRIMDYESCISFNLSFQCNHWNKFLYFQLKLRAPLQEAQSKGKFCRKLFFTIYSNQALQYLIIAWMWVWRTKTSLPTSSFTLIFYILTCPLLYLLVFFLPGWNITSFSVSHWVSMLILI